MDFNKMVNYIEKNKEEHFAKLIAENKRILEEKRARAHQKLEYVQQR